MINPNASQPLSPLAMVRSLRKHRALIGRMARRELVARYRGSFGGLLWAVITPIVMLGVYTFVFSVIFNARWGGVDDQNRAQFAVVLYAGLLIHGLLAETLNAAPNLIAANTNYVKKVVFPLEVLPAVSLCTAFFQFLIGVAVLLVAGWLFNGVVPITAPLVVLVLIPLVLLTLGVAWFLAALGVYVRDVGQVTLVGTTILLFVSPVFFPVTAVPAAFRAIIYVNPLTFLIEQGRNVLIWGRAPDVPGLLAFSVGAFALAWLGYAWFQATRKGFADVL